MKQEIDHAIGQEKYGSLNSKIAIAKANENGGTVVYPNEFQLQLDLDSDEAMATFEANLPTLRQMLEVKDYDIKPSRTPKRHHATVELKKPIFSNTERILLQACLGSDPKRELLSYWRVLKRDPHPTLFVEGGRKPEKRKDLFAVKPFDEVKSGDIGSDFTGESGTVITTGSYDQLKKFDSTGVCLHISDEEKLQMVAVKIEDGNSLLYVYGSDGFGVYI